MTDQNKKASREDDIDEADNDGIHEKLGDAIGDSWAARVYIFIGAIIGLLVAVLFLLIITPRHTATMIVAPAERSGGTDIRALFPENSGFAQKYLTEAIDSGEATDFMRFQSILLGPSVAKRVLEDHPEVVKGIATGKQMLFLDGPKIKTPVQLSKYMKQNVHVTPVAGSPMLEVSYLHPNPQFAVNFIKDIYEAADKIIKDNIKEQAIRRSTYFKKALDEEENPQYRKALTSLYMEQEHVLTMLAMNEPFAATIAEPATTGIAPDWPSYPIVIGVFMFAGMFWNYGRFFKNYRGRGKAKRKRNFDD